MFVAWATIYGHTSTSTKKNWILNKKSPISGVESVTGSMSPTIVANIVIANIIVTSVRGKVSKLVSSVRSIIITFNNPYDAIAHPVPASLPSLVGE